MTGLTDNWRFGYPECAPPVVKDRSDIDIMRRLAVGVDSVAGAIEDRLSTLIERPPSAYIYFNGNVTTTGAANGTIFTAPFNTLSYSTHGSAWYSLTENALIPQERGWYFVYSVIRSAGGPNFTVLRHMRNGLTYQEGRRFEGPAASIDGSWESMTTSDIMLCNPGDRIKTQIKQSGAGSTHQIIADIGMIQILNLDV